MTSKTAGHCPVDDLHSDNDAHDMRTTFLHTHSTVPFDQVQYSVGEWCLICNWSARFLINDALNSDPWSVTSQSILQKHVIHFPKAVVAASLFALLLVHNQVQEQMSSLIISIYLKFLSSAGHI